jgi:hypothetical protein
MQNFVHDWELVRRRAWPDHHPALVLLQNQLCHPPSSAASSEPAFPCSVRGLPAHHHPSYHWYDRPTQPAACGAIWRPGAAMMCGYAAWRAPAATASAVPTPAKSRTVTTPFPARLSPSPIVPKSDHEVSGGLFACIRVQVEIMGSQKCRIVGKSQSAVMMINPIIFTHTRSK